MYLPPILYELGSSQNGEGVIGKVGDGSFGGAACASGVGVVFVLTGGCVGGALLTAFTEVFSEYDTVGGKLFTGLGVDALSGIVFCRGDAS